MAPDSGVSDMLSLYNSTDPTTAGAQSKVVKPWPDSGTSVIDASSGYLRKKTLGRRLVGGSSLSLKTAGFFNHPVLVLNVQVTSASVATVGFATKTSFSRRHLWEVFPAIQDQYLPLYPPDPHMNSNILLRLEKVCARTNGMVNPSYVSLDCVFDLEQRGDSAKTPLTR